MYTLFMEALPHHLRTTPPMVSIDVLGILDEHAGSDQQLVSWVHSCPGGLSLHVVLSSTFGAHANVRLQRKLQSLGCRVTRRSSPPSYVA